MPDAAFFRNQQVEPSSDYIYDALYRLIEATGRENDAAIGAPPQLEGAGGRIAAFRSTPTGALRNYTQRYRYDAVGNIDEMRHIAPAAPASHRLDAQLPTTRPTATA